MPEARTTINRRYDEGLEAAGVRKVVFRLPAEVRHALRAHALVSGQSQNEIGLRALKTYLKEKT